MSEFLKVPHDAIQEGDLRSSRGELAEQEMVPVGEESPKRFVELSVQRDGQERSAGRFVKRQYANSEHALSDAIKADELRAVGIPVPPTVRYSEDEGGQPYLLISDLTEGGKNKVWSMNNSDQELQELALAESDLEDIDRQLLDISNQATRGNFTINADAYFIVQKPNRVPEVLVGDFGIGVAKSEKDEETSRQYNQRSAKRFSGLARNISLGESLPKAA